MNDTTKVNPLELDPGARNNKDLSPTAEQQEIFNKNGDEWQEKMNEGAANRKENQDPKFNKALVDLGEYLMTRDNKSATDKPNGKSNESMLALIPQAERSDLKAIEELSGFTWDERNRLDKSSETYDMNLDKLNKIYVALERKKREIANNTATSANVATVTEAAPDRTADIDAARNDVDAAFAKQGAATDGEPDAEDAGIAPTKNNFYERSDFNSVAGELERSYGNPHFDANFDSLIPDQRAAVGDTMDKINDKNARNSGSAMEISRVEELIADAKNPPKNNNLYHQEF